jgi:hypothetical protein
VEPAAHSVHASNLSRRSTQAAETPVLHVPCKKLYVNPGEFRTGVSQVSAPLLLLLSLQLLLLLLLLLLTLRALKRGCSRQNQQQLQLVGCINLQVVLDYHVQTCWA